MNIYSKIIPLLKSKVEISQANFVIKNFELKQIQIAALRIKPSNFKTYLLNNLKQGKLNELVAIISLNNNYEIIDYKFNGSIEGVNVLLARTELSLVRTRTSSWSSRVGFAGFLTVSSESGTLVSAIIT